MFSLKFHSSECNISKMCIQGLSNILSLCFQPISRTLIDGTKASMKNAHIHFSAQAYFHHLEQHTGFCFWYIYTPGGEQFGETTIAG